MKLLDTMILLNDFLKALERVELDTSANIDSKKILIDQRKYFSDQSEYDNLYNTIQNIDQQKLVFDQQLKTLQDKLYSQIRKKEIEFLQRDYSKQEQEVVTYELIVERFNSISPVFTQSFQTQIQSVVDWRFPALDLNPGDGRYLRGLVAMDPLYTYITDIDVAKSSRERFNTFFAQRRLRVYDDLDKLPQGQMGVIQATHLFEFLPLDPIKDYFKKVVNLLRPGGKFVFTYNNCEHTNSLDFCANGYRTYCTKELMSNAVTSFGLDIIDEQTWQGSHSFMIVQKPGELQTIKESNGLVKVDLNTNENPITNEQIG